MNATCTPLSGPRSRLAIQNKGKSPPNPPTLGNRLHQQLHPERRESLLVEGLAASRSRSHPVRRGQAWASQESPWLRRGCIVACRFALNLGERRRSAPTLGRRGADPQRSARSTGQEPTCPPPAPLACRPCGDGRPRGSLDAHPVRLCGLGTRCLGATKPSRPQVTAVGSLAQLAGQERVPGRSLDARARLQARPRARRAGALPRLQRRRDQPRRQERLRRLVEERRDRDLQAQRAHRQADPGLAAPPAASPPKGANGCAKARGLNGPNSVAVSADGKSVYATSLVSNAVTSFRRNRSTGALDPARGASGCIADRRDPRLRHRPRARRSGRGRPSAPTARTSTSARSSATRSRCSPATRPAAR